MKVATKFALTFFAMSLLVFSAYAFVAARRSAALVLSTASSDLVAMGRALRPAAEEVWRREGEARAREIVQAAGRADVEVSAVWIEGVPSDASPPPPRDAGDSPLVAFVREADGRRRVFVYVPVAALTGASATIELSRDIPGERDLLFAALGDELTAAGLLALFSSVLALGLGQWLIGGPLSRIIGQAARVAGGDLSTRLAVQGSRDIAALKGELNRMCDAIERARDDAAREAEQRIAALEQLRHADRLRTVGTLASGIAHELGTPLNVIWLRGKRLRTKSLPPEEVTKTADIIVEQTERMTKIVRQLLDFSRRGAPERTTVRLDELTRKVVSLLEPLAKKQSVDLRAVAGEDVAVEADRVQLEQAVTNLVVNAVQAVGSSGKQGGSVRVVASLREEKAVVEVIDDGPGIPEDQRARIFEPFFTTKDVGMGTGLGLSVVHGIVVDHGGTIEVRSAPEVETVFTLSLPRVAS